MLYEEKDKKDFKDKPIGEDSTKYGEFMSSFNHWIPPEEQKKRAKHIEEITGDNAENNQKK